MEKEKNAMQRLWAETQLKKKKTHNVFETTDGEPI